MRIELNCARCGGNRFVYPAILTDNSMIVCADCGHEIGTMAELQLKLIQELQSRKAG